MMPCGIDHPCRAECIEKRLSLNSLKVRGVYNRKHRRRPALGRKCRG